MAEPQLVQLLNEVVEQQNLAAQAYKRAERHSRTALHHSREAENRLKAILEQFGIELELK